MNPAAFTEIAEASAKAAALSRSACEALRAASDEARNAANSLAFREARNPNPAPAIAAVLARNLAKDRAQLVALTITAATQAEAAAEQARAALALACNLSPEP